MPARPPPPPRRKEAAPAAGARTLRDARLAGDGKRRPAKPPEVNPLREGLRLERVPDPHVMVIFGATGDLSHRKVFPALAQLWRTNLLPQDWMLVAVGRREYDDDSFRADIAKSLREFSRVPLEPAVERQFLERIAYHRGNFDEDPMYDELVQRLDQIDAEHHTGGNRLFYLATPPSHFPVI